MRSVLTPQAPTDVPALKGSLEMALPVQVGKNPEVGPGRIFMERSISLPYLKESIVKGGRNSLSVFTSDIRVNVYLCLTLHTKTRTVFQ